MAKLIIIRGPLGVGKSTVAKYLAHHIGAEYVSIDKVLIENNLEKDEDFVAEDFLKINQIILPELEKNFDRGVSVIVEGNFYFKEVIDDLVDSVSVDSMVFTLKASLQTCIERDKNREPSFGAHTAEAIYNLVNKFDYGTEILTDDKTTPQVVMQLQNLIK